MSILVFKAVCHVRRDRKSIAVTFGLPAPKPRWQTGRKAIFQGDNYYRADLQKKYLVSTAIDYSPLLYHEAGMQLYQVGSSIFLDYAWNRSLHGTGFRASTFSRCGKVVSPALCGHFARSFSFSSSLQPVIGNIAARLSINLKRYRNPESDQSPPNVQGMRGSMLVPYHIHPPMRTKKILNTVETMPK